MAAAVRHLPFGLARIVPPNLVGFAVMNGFTFACDLALLTALHGGLRWPVAVSITLSYAIASGLSYLLNRAFNFHSHAAIGRQLATYVGVIAVNYLAWILGVGAGLASLGVSYQLARTIAGLCEAVYMYAAMRWLVFRDTRASPGPGPGPEKGPRRLWAEFLAHTAETLPVSRVSGHGRSDPGSRLGLLMARPPPRCPRCWARRLFRRPWPARRMAPRAQDSAAVPRYRRSSAGAEGASGARGRYGRAARAGCGRARWAG